MKPKGKLYLIPASLGESELTHILPQFNFEIIKHLRIFIVENIRSARRFLRQAGYTENFDDISFHLLDKHTSDKEASTFLADIDVHDIGLLSEAGVPCIADPGAHIVMQAHLKGAEVVPLTGPSSIILALMASGMNGQQFIFHGYLPVQKSERERKIKELERQSVRNRQTQIFIETPYRNVHMFESLVKTCADNTMLCIATNLTLKDQLIQTRPILNWIKNKPDIHKKPTVFLISC
jgi:16S rRNA (cytidine1402-2'-O)-methyltransferase